MNDLQPWQHIFIARANGESWADLANFWSMSTEGVRRLDQKMERIILAEADATFPLSPAPPVAAEEESTPAQVDDRTRARIIWIARANGESLASIAEFFSISEARVRAIDQAVQRRVWASVNTEIEREPWRREARVKERVRMGRRLSNVVAFLWEVDARFEGKDERLRERLRGIVASLHAATAREADSIDGD